MNETTLGADIGIQNPAAYALWAAITIAVMATGSYGIDLYSGKNFDLKRRGLLIIVVGIMLNAAIAIAWKGQPDPNWQIIIAGGCGIFLDQIIAKRSQLLAFFAGRNPAAAKVVDVVDDEQQNAEDKRSPALLLRLKNGVDPPPPQ